MARSFLATHSAGIACLMVSCIACVAPAAVLAADARNVLVIFSDSRQLPANVEAEQALHQTIVSTEERPVDLYAEFLDRSHFDSESYPETTVRYLREKYAVRAPDVVVAGGTYALQLLLRNRGNLFSTVPVVYVGIAEAELQAMGPVPADVIGVPTEFDYPAAIDQALRLHPSATRLVLVSGGAAIWDRISESDLREAGTGFESRVTVEHLKGLTTAALLAQLRMLGPQTVVFTPGYFSDGAGRFFTPRESVRLMAEAATAPIYGPFSTFLGTGVVGGVMPSYAAMGRQAGTLVNGLLSGADPASLKLPATPSVLQIDWRQAQRWGITEQQLPPGTIVHFKEPTLWEAYGRIALIALAVILLQTGLIAALLYERALQRRTAAALESSERRMVLAARTARLSNWVWNVDRAEANGSVVIRVPHTPVSREPPAMDFGQVLEITHPADRERLSRAVQQVVATDDELNVEYRVVQPNQVRWFAARGRLDQGNPGRLRGVAIDITQRKIAELQAEQDRTALGHMTRVSLLGQLSASIAHQLNQPLAAILSNAEAAQKMLRRDDLDLEELRAICDDIVTEDNRASQVIRRLGALYKRDERELRPVDVNELIRETLGLLHTDLVTRQVTVEIDYAASLPTIEAERVQLQQVLMNLVVNAADAMNGVPESERLLSVSSGMSDDNLRIDVVDAGPGIAADDLDHIFDMFWTTKTAGMGIGLAICRSITAAHGGTLTVANNPERGATFSVTLPLRAA